MQPAIGAKCQAVFEVLQKISRKRTVLRDYITDRVLTGARHLSSTAYRQAVGSTQPPVLCVPEGLSRTVTRPASEAENSSPSGFEVQNS